MVTQEVGLEAGRLETWLGHTGDLWKCRASLGPSVPSVLQPTARCTSMSSMQRLKCLAA